MNIVNTPEAQRQRLAQNWDQQAAWITATSLLAALVTADDWRRLAPILLGIAPRMLGREDTHQPKSIKDFGEHRELMRAEWRKWETQLAAAGGVLAKLATPEEWERFSSCLGKIVVRLSGGEKAYEEQLARAVKRLAKAASSKVSEN